MTVYPSNDENSHVGRGPAAVPPNVRRVQEDFNALKPSYRGWLEQQTTEDPDTIMGVVAFVLGSCAMREDITQITAPSVETLRLVLDFIGEMFPETLESAKMEILGFLEFLDESDEFTGSDQLFDDLYELVDDEEDIDWKAVYDEIESNPDSWATVDIEMPAPPAEAPVAPRRVVNSSSLGADESLAAMEALPLTARARALLKWIGERRDLTATGVLRRPDIKPAAARLGVNAVGSATGSPTWYALGMSNGVLEVRSMPEVPRLDLYWQMLRLVGLIEVCGKRVGLTEFGWTFLAKHSASTPKAVLGMAAAAYGVLGGVLPRSNGELEHSGDHVATVLISGATHEPWSAEAVLEGTENGKPRPDLFSKTITTVVGKRIRQWEEDGLVEIGETITIPEVLLPALATALAKPYTLDVGAPRSPKLSR